MEQKKILWIVVAVSVFVLIIFGSALILYAPSRSTGPSLQQSTAVTPAAKTASQIDPDSWVKEPGTLPGPGTTPPVDPTLPPGQGNINLTIVNGDNTGANYGTLDVTSLTKPADSLPLSVSAIEGAPSNIPGQTSTNTVAPPTTENTATKTVSPKATSAVSTPEKQTSVTQAAPKPAASKQVATKPVAQKTVTVIEYWIQTGSFSSKMNAEKARDALSARYLKAEIFTKEVAGTNNYRVRVGPYKSKNEADYWLDTVKQLPDFSSSYVSEVKTKK